MRFSKKRSVDSIYEPGESSASSAARSCSITPQTPRSRRGLRTVRRPLSSSDLGDCDQVCRHCGAAFWYDERLTRSTVLAAIYTHCCKEGAVVLPIPLRPPDGLFQLLQDRSFLDDIRAYNSMFAMTSFGANIDYSVNATPGPYTFKVSGQISHRIGSFTPLPYHIPRFLQLYMYDTENEVSNRIRAYQGDRPARSRELSPTIVQNLSEILHASNELVRTFKTAQEIAGQLELPEYSVRLYNNVPDRRYDPPASGTLGAIVFAHDENVSKFDIVVHSKSEGPQQVSKLHPSYMALQYPILFPFGEQGWRRGLRLRDNGRSGDRSLTINMFYAYLLHHRPDLFATLLHGGSLFQQFTVDAYLCIEECRLDYFRNHQDELRVEYVSGVYDAISRGDTEGSQIGRPTILPPSFVGGPRYMYNHYQDALAICRVYGNPQYFVTFTCNVNWPEIKRYMDANGVHQAQNRPDIIARVFRMKVVQFIKYLKKKQPFGPVVAHLYTIEFQKRGLPHCHTLVWVAEGSKIMTPADVDKYISAELPDPNLEPQLYSTVTKYMIHGPCGLLNPRCICMKEGRCSKSFPKPFYSATHFDDDGYVRYKRRDGFAHQMQNGVTIHNGFVVPYNKDLSLQFDAHINVEYCGWNMMIKYLFKYISKGADRVSFNIERREPNSDSPQPESVKSINEIDRFLDGRYICPHEAAWRILNFPIHERDPAVTTLAVHLHNMQSVSFKADSQLQRVIDNPAFGTSTLVGWMRSNNRDPRGRNLTYIEYPNKYWWDATHKEWVFRVRDNSKTIGRLIYVHPTAGELFYLRMLLSHQRGCESYEDICHVKGTPYPTFRLACEALGLLGDDKEWLEAFNDASAWASASELRSLFCHLLLFCGVTNPPLLWERSWRKMSDDFLYAITSTNASAHAFVDDDLLQQKILLELEHNLNTSTPPTSLSKYKLPMPTGQRLATLENRLLLEETMYDKVALHADHLRMVSQLNDDQLDIYKRVQHGHSNNEQVLMFVYGHGGTGKTFLWSTILAYIRSQGKIALAVAASGIAALLLPAGRTAHSRFNIPPEITDQTLCNIKKRTNIARLIAETSLIIWDEATMTERKCLECVDRTFRDIFSKPDVPFGGMSILFGGDFRQTLPVLPKKRPAQIIAATFPNSPLWQFLDVCKLSNNMRLSSASPASISFASWILDIGNGDVGEQLYENSEDVKVVTIPDSMVIQHCDDNLKALITFVYTPTVISSPTAADLSSRAIVTPKNIYANEINELVLQMSSAASRIYHSQDSIVSHARQTGDLSLLYPQDYLNRLSFSDLPQHALHLKINCSVILLRNLNQTAGLCNGTRLIVTQLLSFVVEAKIITGIAVGNRVYIPKIYFVHNSPDLPFVFTRKQFPLKVCYAMTINKSQGQSLNKVGIYLPKPVFGHGQLYVALSRATSPYSVKMLILDNEGKASNTTNNVVFKDLLRALH